MTPKNKSHQISLLISMAKSSSLSMSTGEHLAFLRQEHRVELTQHHLRKEEKTLCDLFSVLIDCMSHQRKIMRYWVVLINALVIIILTSQPRLQCISFHVPRPSPLVAIVKHYANKRPGHRWKSKHHY